MPLDALLGLFVTGMVVYSLYVLVFPLTYNMSARRENYDALIADYEKRRANFEDQVTPDKVTTIERTRIDDSKKSFTKWFRITVGTYAVVIILALLTAWLASVPNSFIASLKPSSTTTATLTPPPSVTATPHATLALTPTLAPTPIATATP